MKADGNFILGPTHNPAPEMTVQEGVPQGTVFNFTMESADSKIYPGIAREPGTFGTADPNDPAKLIVTTSHPAPYTRRVAVYVPKQYVPGTAAPFIVGADGPDRALFTALDNLIAQHRVPVMIAISIGNGSGDAQGSERGLEYDTMSGLYAEFVEKEVLPLVEKQYNVKLTKDPEAARPWAAVPAARARLIMAWYHPELYHRVLTYSGTYVNQQWPSNPETPHGAWEFHEHLIPNSPVKPIRIWMEVGDRDNFNPNVMRDNMHDWVLANENMARVLAAKGYHYQFVFARNAGHTDRTVKQQTLPEALEYVWQGYPIAARRNNPSPLLALSQPEVAVIADAAGARRPEQREIEVAQRKEQPAEREMHAAAPPAPGQQALDVFDADHQQRRRGAGAPAFGDHFEIAGELFQAVEGEAAIVLGIFVERVAEGRHQMQVAAGGEHAAEFAGDADGVAHMFQNRVAFHALEDGVAERQLLRIGGDIDTGHGEEVEIDVAGDGAAGAADVEIPAAQREIDGLARVHDERRGGLQRAAQPAAGLARAIALFESRGVPHLLGRRQDFELRGKREEIVFADSC